MEIILLSVIGICGIAGFMVYLRMATTIHNYTDDDCPRGLTDICYPPEPYFYEKTVTVYRGKTKGTVRVRTYGNKKRI